MSAKVKAGLRLSQAQKNLLDQALRDGLTGAFNRRYWENALMQACQGESPFLLALADIDRFKEINDGWGHQVGDAFLRDLTRIWSGKLQDSEIFARLGGDEFGCLFHRSPNRLKVLRLEVEKTLTAIFPDLPVGLSLGYVQFQPTRPMDCSTLMGRADSLLYREKRRRKKIYQCCVSETGAV